MEAAKHPNTVFSSKQIRSLGMQCEQYHVVSKSQIAHAAFAHFIRVMFGTMKKALGFMRKG
jgi:hypothetical protein